jgi:hypothetical protein
MIRFLFSTLYPALLLPWFLDWAETESEAQIDKMQQQVHFTPGAQPPVPPLVAVGGAALLSGHFLFGWVLRLRGWQAIVSLIFGGIAGLMLFVGKKS